MINGKKGIIKNNHVFEDFRVIFSASFSAILTFLNHKTLLFASLQKMYAAPDSNTIAKRVLSIPAWKHKRKI